MCGRFVLFHPFDTIRRSFDLTDDHAPLLFTERYNIAPTQDAAVIRQNRDLRELSMLRWGLVPHWAKDPSIGAKMINARIETVAEKPSFKDALAARRCLVPASAFYEWKQTDTGKQPYVIRRATREPLVFAGLWERCNSLETFTIITRAASPSLLPLHTRQPVMLHPDAFAVWLDPDTSDPLTSIKEIDAHELETYPVSTRANSVKNDDASLLEMIKS